MRRTFFTLTMVGLLIGAVATPSSAHCDGMDGPVVKAAQRALTDGVVEHILIWIPANDEPAVRAAFDKTRRVRELSPAARELADTYFFELVVRLHRAAEGAPFTGLQPAGRDLGPAIPAADRAMEMRSLDPLMTLMQHAVAEGLRAQFNEVVEKKDFAVTDVGAGRAFVKAYVEYVHFVERLHDAATLPAHGHAETER